MTVKGCVACFCPSCGRRHEAPPDPAKTPKCIFGYFEVLCLHCAALEPDVRQREMERRARAVDGRAPVDKSKARRR